MIKFQRILNMILNLICIVEELKRYQPHREFGDRRMGVTGARTFFYQGEVACEKNMEIFLRCIEAVATTTSTTGFAAIKLTALGRPQLLVGYLFLKDFYLQRRSSTSALVFLSVCLSVSKLKF